MTSINSDETKKEMENVCQRMGSLSEGYGRAPSSNHPFLWVSNLTNKWKRSFSLSGKGNLEALMWVDF